MPPSQELKAFFGSIFGLIKVIPVSVLIGNADLVIRLISGYNTRIRMQSFWKSLAAVGIAGMLLLGGLGAPITLAQSGLPPEECNDPAFAAQFPETCTYNVGGAGVTPQDIQAAINSPTPNLANTTAYILYTLTVVLRGTVSVNEEVSAPGSEAAFSQPTSLSQATEQFGAIGGVGYLMGSMIKNQPASTQNYVAYVVGNSRLLGDQAYAQGVGFGSLSPILGTWVAFRDLAYYLLIIMFFISGFLILIRHKISGQVAVTVQTILPRLILTLVLITFSYAIAGFIIDIMFLAIYFVINTFDGSIFNPNAEFPLFYNTNAKSLTDIALNTNIFEFMLGYVFNNNESASAWGAANALGDMVQQTIISVAGADSVVGFFTNNDLFKSLITIVFTLIFGIALLIAMFRTFFALLMSYAGFIINVVLSPFILLPGVMPNNNAFGDWVKNLLAGLAPFVVTIFMIFMSLALTGGPQTNQPGVGYRSINNTQIEGLRLPLIMTGEIDSSAFIGLVGMGFMLLLPEAVGLAKKMVGAKGGIFDEYKDKAVNAFKQGRKPGMTIARGLAGAPIGAAMGAATGYAGAKAGWWGDKDNASRSAATGAAAGFGVGAIGPRNSLRLLMKPIGMVNSASNTVSNVSNTVEQYKAASQASGLVGKFNAVVDTAREQRQNAILGRPTTGPTSSSPGRPVAGSAQATPRTPGLGQRNIGRRRNGN